jgi:hypothetical protein
MKRAKLRVMALGMTLARSCLFPTWCRPAVEVVVVVVDSPFLFA